MEIIGHQKQWNILREAALADKLPQGMIFCGPEGVGKKALAEKFFKYLHCGAENVEKRPCGRCPECLASKKRTHPDLYYVEPENGASEIKISQVRELIFRLSMKSAGPLKAAIVDKAHLMTRDSQNGFLKLLEEPRGNAILFLITEYPEALLPTILSRSQKIRFSLVPVSDIENYLKNMDIASAMAKELAEFSDGRPGKAFELISDKSGFLKKKKIQKDLFGMADRGLAERFQYAKSLSESGSSEDSKIDIEETLDIWLKCLRKVFLKRLSGPAFSPGQRSGFDRYPLSKIKELIFRLQETKFLASRTNVNQKMALEIFLMEL